MSAGLLQFNEPIQLENIDEDSSLSTLSSDSNEVM